MEQNVKTGTTTLSGEYYYSYPPVDTFQKKVERYMKCDKRTLAEMLALRDTEYETPNYGITYEYPLNGPSTVEPIYTTTTSNKAEMVMDSSVTRRQPKPEEVTYTDTKPKCCGGKKSEDDTVGQFSFGCQ